jgi:hypothetical protein
MKLREAKCDSEYVVNRSGNRPSHEQAAWYFDRSIALCRQAGFKKIHLRGDTDFTQSEHLDRWDQAADVTFTFGIDATKALDARAADLPPDAWKTLVRRPRYDVQTVPRRRRSGGQPAPPKTDYTVYHPTSLQACQTSGMSKSRKSHALPRKSWTDQMPLTRIPRGHGRWRREACAGARRNMLQHKKLASQQRGRL